MDADTSRRIGAGTFLATTDPEYFVNIAQAVSLQRLSDSTTRVRFANGDVMHVPYDLEFVLDVASTMR